MEVATRVPRKSEGDEKYERVTQSKILEVQNFQISFEPGKLEDFNQSFRDLYSLTKDGTLEIQGKFTQ